MHVGYSRVSTDNQNSDRQLSGVELEERFIDQASGKNRDRPQLELCLRWCRRGDTLHVHSIDRLARNLRDLQAIVEDLVGRGVTVSFHQESLVFSGDKDNPMSVFMMQMIGAFAEFEHRLFRLRQREGLEAARKRGVKMGRRVVLSFEQIEEVRRRVVAGEKKGALALEFKCSRPTIYNVCKDKPEYTAKV